MRKSQREIKNFDEIIKVLDKCDTIRLGLYDDKFPYVVPLSFGWEVVGGKLFVYFHCAKEGKKIDLISKNGAVALEADICNGYVNTDRGVTADYESIIACGYAERVCGDEAVHGIKLLLEHCGIEGYPAEECVMTGAVAVYKVTVESVTGKKRFI